mmetsp:Transcript_1646/g.2670  ORF Transcript_1646/g.2670 Transcript_1646/m.2670 type:complete len:204 (+) Transcript_1646:280-891(+)
MLSHLGYSTRDVFPSCSNANTRQQTRSSSPQQQSQRQRSGCSIHRYRSRHTRHWLRSIRFLLPQTNLDLVLFLLVAQQSPLQTNHHVLYFLLFAQQQPHRLLLQTNHVLYFLLSAQQQPHRLLLQTNHVVLLRVAQQSHHQPPTQLLPTNRVPRSLRLHSTRTISCSACLCRNPSIQSFERMLGRLPNHRAHSIEADGTIFSP